MLSGIYYIHEGGTQSKEPPPELYNQTHQHPPKTTLPCFHTGPALHPKRLHGGNKTQG